MCLVAIFLFERRKDCLWCAASIFFFDRELSNINTSINACEHGPRQTDCARCKKHKAYLYLESNTSKRILLCKLSFMTMALQAPALEHLFAALHLLALLASGSWHLHPERCWAGLALPDGSSACSAIKKLPVLLSSTHRKLPQPPVGINQARFHFLHVGKAKSLFT